jgi:hypothetical protein
MHRFRLLFSLALYTNFVIRSAGFGLLVDRTRYALLFCPRQRSTRRAVPVAAVASMADHHFPMTSLTVENPAIWQGHL